MIRGNPGRRPLPELELRPKAELPPCPPHLKGEARRLYRTLGAELALAGVLTALDRVSFAMYCATWAHHVQAERERHKWPPTSPEAKVLARISAQQAALAYRIGADFGLNPGARHRPALVDKPLVKTAQRSGWDQFEVPVFALSPNHARAESEGRVAGMIREIAPPDQRTAVT